MHSLREGITRRVWFRTHALEYLPTQFGVKYQGVKYDAVLKGVKPTSPFHGELQEGDRLVAMNGRRVSEANK